MYLICCFKNWLVSNSDDDDEGFYQTWKSWKMSCHRKVMEFLWTWNSLGIFVFLEKSWNFYGLGEVMEVLWTWKSHGISHLNFHMLLILILFLYDDVIPREIPVHIRIGLLLIFFILLALSNSMVHRLVSTSASLGYNWLSVAALQMLTTSDVHLISAWHPLLYVYN